MSVEDETQRKDINKDDHKAHYDCDEVGNDKNRIDNAHVLQPVVESESTNDVSLFYLIYRNSPRTYRFSGENRLTASFQMALKHRHLLSN